MPDAINRAFNKEAIYVSINSQDIERSFGIKRLIKKKINEALKIGTNYKFGEDSSHKAQFVIIDLDKSAREAIEKRLKQRKPNSEIAEFFRYLNNDAFKNQILLHLYLKTLYSV